MKCRKCKADIPDDALFCAYCGIKQDVEKKSPRTRGNGQGCAVQRGSTWRAVWTECTYLDDDGKLRQKRRTKDGFKTKTAALKYAANPPRKEAPAFTLREYWRTWSKGAMLDIGKSKQTAYKIAWEKLSSIADQRIDALTIEQLQRTVDEHAATYYPAKDMRVLLSHLYKLAMAEGKVQRNLSEFIRLPKLEEKEMEAFSETEIRRMWESYKAGNENMGYILLMIYTGMMPGELYKLEPRMIQWSTHEIVGCGLKTKKRRETPMVFPSFLVPVLVDLVDRASEKTGRLLAMHPDTFRKEYALALQRANVRYLPPYSCRHTTATALALGNVAPSVIQEIMRHTRLSTTQRYIHPDVSDALKAVEEMVR